MISDVKMRIRHGWKRAVSDDFAREGDIGVRVRRSPPSSGFRVRGEPPPRFVPSLSERNKTLKISLKN
ncbi:hypothetical protein U1Q18_027485 [Sarracenia purpurea var. burkii]